MICYLHQNSYRQTLFQLGIVLLYTNTFDLWSINYNIILISRDDHAFGCLTIA